jgi:hypothetical protein
MPCMYCVHFEKVSDPQMKPWDPVKSAEMTEGKCTLTPEWVGVSGLHYCSHLHVRDASLVGFWWRNMHEYSGECEKQRTRALKAERALKDLKKMQGKGEKT